MDYLRRNRYVWLAALLMLPALLPGCGSEAEQAAVQISPPVPALADTLIYTFRQIRLAAEQHDQGRLFELIDTTGSSEAYQVGQPSRVRRPKEPYWRRLTRWPATDTLVFHQLVAEPPYARLALEGSGSYLNGDDAVCYTVLLFREVDDGWVLTAGTALERRRHDRFGNHLTFHETDLPSNLRFPRLF
jgi:hypothetical protein